MSAISAGILVFRRIGPEPEFLLGHPGGPLWARKDKGAWMIPKGAVEAGEDPLDAARREFVEETGITAPKIGRALKPLRQSRRKTVLCWIAEADLDLSGFMPGRFEMEWPPRSGTHVLLPEIDRLAYIPTDVALEKILPSQALLVTELLSLLRASASV